MDVVRRIQAFDAGRDPERLQIKYRKMRGSAFAFLRGTCHLFYGALPRGDVFKSAPLAWVCGDLHLENFGCYKGDNRLAYFDINDFDEAALAPATWDLLRMLTSLRIAARGLSMKRSEATQACTVFLDAYGMALALGKAYWVERETAQGLVRDLLDGLRDRQRSRFLDARTQFKGRKRILLVDGIKALPATEAQRSAITEFMAGFAQTQPNPGFFQVLDVARRIAGTGSLGVDRHVVLVLGKGSPDGNYLLDLKLALPSSLAPHLKVVQPRWKTQADRVVTTQRRMQAVSMAFLHPVMLGKIPYVLRDLQPADDRITLDRSNSSMRMMEQLVRTMGNVVAWAQLRSAGRDGSVIADELIDFAQRRKWQATLLGASEHCAEQVREGAAAFDIAYDDGAFVA